MDEYFAKFWDFKDFPARWHCGNWAEFHGWLHVGSDAAVFAAYMCIPMVLAYFVRRRKDLPFPRIFWMFVVFICSCGFTHLIEAVIFWVPIYRIAGATKFVTAIVSWATVVALFYAMPQAIRLRSPEELAQEVETRTEQLRSAEAFQRSILESSPVGMVLVSAEGCIEYANLSAQELFGLSREDCVGRDAETLVPGGVLRLPSSIDESGGRSIHTVRRADGTTLEVQIGVTPMDLPTGPGLLANLLDVTEQRRAEKALADRNRDLQQANEDLDGFVYVASHDLRTPLQGVKSIAQWIEEDNREHLEASSLEHLALLRRRVSRLERHLDDLLAYSRAGRSELSLVELDAGDAVREVVELLDPPPSVTVRVSEDMPRLRTARAPFVQVMQNLIQNAIKHHDRDEQHIEVGVCELDDAYAFTVTDDGPGIPPEYRDRAFKMFETLRPRDEVEGSGMGLALIKKVVGRMGGDVQIESASPRGTTVVLTWPKTIGEQST